MARALELARRHGLYAGPNPRVGAVLVRKGRVVGEGAHRRFGGPHAEVEALERAGSLARGSTLYVTLEPCSHHGKTPPCADALVRAGVRRVVSAMGDPDPRVSGRGFAQLKAAGVKVERGLLEAAARSLNAGFVFSMEKKRPLVTLKAAATLDGKIATARGRSRWITGLEARQAVHGLRSRADAVLVGVSTVLKDDPRLDVRLKGWARRDGWPLRVVLDSGLRTGIRSKALSGAQGTLLFCSKGASPARQRALERAGAEVERVGSRDGKLDLRAVLKSLHQREVRHLLVEGGGKVHASFLAARLADRVALFLSYKMLGGENAPTWLEGAGGGDPNRCPRLTDVVRADLGDDLLISGKVVY